MLRNNLVLWVVFAALMGLVLGASVVSIPQPSERACNQSGEGGSAQHLAPNNAVNPLINYTAKGQAQTTCTYQSFNNPKSGATWLDWVIARWEAWTAFGTLGLAFFAFIQWRDSSASSERQLRAYVWVKAIDLCDFDVGKLPYVRLEVRNAGKTPAYDFEISAGAIVCENPLPLATPFPKITGDAATKMVLHPGGEPFNAVAPLRAALKGGMTKDQVLGLIKGEEARLFVFAKVTYVDAFKKNRETFFCASVDASDALGGKPKFHVEFAHAPIHNTAN